MAGETQIVYIGPNQIVVRTGRTEEGNTILVSISKHMLLTGVHGMALIATESTIHMVFARYRCDCHYAKYRQR